MPGERAQQHREAHHSDRRQDPGRARLQQAGNDSVNADLLKRDDSKADRQAGCKQKRYPSDGAPKPRAAPATGRFRLNCRQSLRWYGGKSVTVEFGAAPKPRHPAARELGSVSRYRLLINLNRLGAYQRPAVLSRAGSSAVAQCRAACRLKREVAQRLSERDRISMGHEHAVDAVNNDVAVASDLTGDDRRAGSEGLGQNHPKTLAAERRGYQQVGLSQQALLLVIVNEPGDANAARIDQERLDVCFGGADDRQLGIDKIPQPFEGREQDRQPFSIDRLPDEDELQLPGRANLLHRRPAGRHANAVGNHAVAATVEAARRP